MLTVFFFFFRFRLDSSRCYFIDRWIRYLWSWLLLLLDFHCFVWSLYLEVSSILVILVVLGSLTPISLMFCLWFRWIRYLWSWLLLFLDFYCFIWSLLAPWGYFQFWLCSWIINMISLMFYLAILFLWFDFVPLDVISFLTGQMMTNRVLTGYPNYIWLIPGWSPICHH